MSEVARTSNPSLNRGATVKGTSAQDDLLNAILLDGFPSTSAPVPELNMDDLSEGCQKQVDQLLNSATRRETTPVRKAFVRTDDPAATPPLAQIVSTRGRGGDVPLKLYIALLRRCSAPPFDTNLSARRWAQLLDLEDPARRGARRVQDAIKRLEERALINVTPSRGDPSLITLLCEDGSGARYTRPADSARSGTRYLQIPDRLWKGYIQKMRAPALAMLLILLAEPASRKTGMWWSVENFPNWYKISPSMRAEGTKELITLGLVRVTKQMIDTPRGGNSDDRDRVRNLYVLTGPAAPSTETPAP